MYNDYPGCSDSYDDDRSIEQTQLDAAIAKRDAVEADLSQLQTEGDGYTVLGRFIPDIDRARIARARELERCYRDVERLTATITALMTEIAPDDDYDYVADDFNFDAMRERGR